MLHWTSLAPCHTAPKPAVKIACRLNFEIETPLFKLDTPIFASSISYGQIIQLTVDGYEISLTMCIPSGHWHITFRNVCDRQEPQWTLSTAINFPCKFDCAIFPLRMPNIFKDKIQSHLLSWPILRWPGPAPDSSFIIAHLTHFTLNYPISKLCPRLTAILGFSPLSFHPSLYMLFPHFCSDWVLSQQSS